MDVTIVDSLNFIFTNGQIPNKKIPIKEATISADKLMLPQPGSLKSLNLLAKLKSMLLAQRLPEDNLHQLSEPMNCKLMVSLFFGPILPNYPTHNACCEIGALGSDEIFKRFGLVSGGSRNITAKIQLMLAASNEKLHIDVDDAPITKDNRLCFYFNLTKSMTQILWGKRFEFSATLSITLKLNAEATNLIHLSNLGESELINRKLLEDAKQSGDLVITAKHGEKIECHKVFLIAQSDVFRAMFTNKMQEAQSNTVTMPDISEAGVRALLAFLYCYDIKEALLSSEIAVELLMAADKYAIKRLNEIMKDIILDKENSSFSVASAVRLLIFVGNKEEEGIKEIEDKAKTIIQSKSEEELKQCKEFRELFNNPDSAISMCIYLMQINCACGD